MDKIGIGSRFEKLNMEPEYILSQVDFDKVCLINLKTGNRYFSPVLVKDVHDITFKELKLIMGNDIELFKFLKLEV